MAGTFCNSRRALGPAVLCACWPPCSLGTHTDPGLTQAAKLSPDLSPSPYQVGTCGMTHGQAGDHSHPQPHSALKGCSWASTRTAPRTHSWHHHGGLHWSPTTPSAPPFLQSWTPRLWITESLMSPQKPMSPPTSSPERCPEGPPSPPQKPGEGEEMPSKEAPNSTP